MTDGIEGAQAGNTGAATDTQPQTGAGESTGDLDANTGENPPSQERDRIGDSDEFDKTYERKLAEKDDITDYVEFQKDEEQAEREDKENQERGKRPSRNQRLKRKMEALSAELEYVKASGDPNMQSHIRKVGAFEARVESVRDQLPDFDVTIQAAGDAQISPPVAALVLESKQGPRLAYELAKDPQLLDYLNSLPEREAAIAIGRAEQYLAGHQGGAAPSARAEPRTVTKAPRPFKPLTGGGAAPSKGLAELANKDDISEYAKQRDGQRRDR